MIFSLFISCPRGLEYLLEEEMKELGLNVTSVSPQGVYGDASLAIVYQLCLWSRIANRIQLILFKGEARNQKMLYDLCRQYPWQTLFDADKSLGIEFHGSSDAFRNTMFGAQVVKDAIVDTFREFGEERPVIDRHTPQIRIHAYLKHDNMTISFDLTGYSLHQRGYRLEAGEAPLKENIAAAMLMRAQWHKHTDWALHDPFCGSGTLVIEAAMMAANMAPGLLRQDQALHHWKAHQANLWNKTRHTAQAQIKPPTTKLRGTDIDRRAIDIAKANALRAGVAEWVEFEMASLSEAKAISPQPGLFIANPPYGERLSDSKYLTVLYKQIGQVLHNHYQGWQAAILTSDTTLAKTIGLRARKQYTLYNGALECKLYCFELTADNQLKDYANRPLSTQAQMFVNRLQKNATHLKKWAKRNQITCYRIYDADLPEYAFAIDLYNDYAVLQEYAPPASVPQQVAERRCEEVMRAVPAALDLDPKKIVLKQRRQQKGSTQYQKLAQTHDFLQILEGSARLNVNLFDYLDTGLFLDHRPIRLQFAKLPRGTRFLNCFCYTATASVHAALAGATTTNVDLSNTYLKWAEENFKLNPIDISRHQFIQYDCLEWLKVTQDQFDVIFLDPPSFSNSKRMLTTLDIQRDHEALIESAMRLLSPEGTLYFSTNLRHFKLSTQINAHYQVKDISDGTIDLDFKRNQRIHQCFKIQKS